MTKILNNMDDITVFDLETSGLNTAKDRAIEIGAIRYHKGEIVSEFGSLISFDGKLSDKITDITGIKDSDLIGAMPEDMAFKIFLNMSRGSVMVAHNAIFDIMFIDSWLRRNDLGRFKSPVIDTLTISRDRHPYPHNLPSMMKAYNIEQVGDAHRALNDVRSTSELFFKMNKEEDTSKWINKIGYLEKYGEPKNVPDHISLFPTQNRYE